MPWHPTLTALRKILADLYSNVEDARRAVEDAGIDSSRIAFDAKAITNWHNILKEAVHNNQIHELLGIAQSEYGKNSKLHQAIKAYESHTTELTRHGNTQAVLKITEPPKPLPPPECNGFVGRVQELAYYAASLATDHVAIIAGMPGVGKTALAAQLARQVAKQPDRIFWHRFDANGRIESIIWRLAGMLYYQGQPLLWEILEGSRQSRREPPPHDILLDYLAQSLLGQDYLLCLDDFHYVEDDKLVDKMVERLQRILPTGSLQLIITSRHMHVLPQTPLFVPLAGLNLSDTRQLLLANNIKLTSDLTDTLHRRTDGNAELLFWIIKTLAQTPRPQHFIDRLAVESNVAPFLVKKISEGISEEEKQVISGITALLGYPSSSNAIAATVEVDNIYDILSNLVSHFLLREQKVKSYTEYIVHPFLQDYFYDRLGERKRQSMHHRAAEYYENIELDLFQATLHYVRAGELRQAVEVGTSDVLAVMGQGQASALKHLLEGVRLTQLPRATQAQAELALGELAAFLGEASIAKTHFSYAVNLVQDASDSTIAHQLAAQASLGMGTVLEYEDPDKALEWTKRGLATGHEIDVSLRARLLNRLGSLYIARSEHREATTVLEKALALTSSTLPNSLRASILINLNSAYVAQKDMIKANACAEEALLLAQTLNDFYALLAIRSNLAIDRELAGDWVQAVNDYTEALRLAEQLGTLAEQSRIHNLLGHLRCRQARSQEAEDHFQKALTIAQEANLKEHSAATLSSSALLLIRQKRWAEAEAALQEAMQLAITHGWDYMLPEIYGERALVNLGRGQHSTALKQATQASKVARKLIMPLEEGVALRIKGQILVALGKTRKAIGVFKESLVLVTNTDRYEEICTTLHYGRTLSLAGQMEAGQALLATATAALKTLGFTEDTHDHF